MSGLLYRLQFAMSYLSISPKHLEVATLMVGPLGGCVIEHGATDRAHRGQHLARTERHLAALSEGAEPAQPWEDGRLMHSAAACDAE